jgi:hypothetical protein
VALLAHDLIDETSLKVANKSTSIHSIVKNIGQKKTVGSGAGGGNASTTDLDQRVDDFNKKMGEEQVSVLDGLTNSTHSQKVYLPNKHLPFIKETRIMETRRTLKSKSCSKLRQHMHCGSLPRTTSRTANK